MDIVRENKNSKVKTFNKNRRPYKSTIVIINPKTLLQKITKNIFQTVTYAPNTAGNHKMKHHKGSKNWKEVVTTEDGVLTNRWSSFKVMALGCFDLRWLWTKIPRFIVCKQTITFCSIYYKLRSSKPQSY